MKYIALTSRSSDIIMKSSFNQLESSQLVLKNIGKETQVFTYWNDSGFYQYQLIKEQSKEQTATQLKSKEIQDVKEEQMSKESEPVRVWGFVVSVVVLCIIGCFLIKKF